tara:strand:- start:1529 stop:1753 length:225 start_codon:yes stop_codon:yes gene_type:complete
MIVKNNIVDLKGYKDIILWDKEEIQILDGVLSCKDINLSPVFSIDKGVINCKDCINMPLVDFGEQIDATESDIY